MQKKLRNGEKTTRSRSSISNRFQVRFGSVPWDTLGHWWCSEPPGVPLAFPSPRVRPRKTNEKCTGKQNEKQTPTTDPKTPGRCMCSSFAVWYTSHVPSNSFCSHNCDTATNEAASKPPNLEWKTKTCDNLCIQPTTRRCEH